MNAFMRRIKNYVYGFLALILIWTLGSHLYEWLMTGRLYVTPSLQPAHYVTYAQDPVEFILGFAFLVSMVVIGLVAIATAAVED
ncbi:MAG: hypothetical protein ABI561_21120 [Bradyrhizobium sp.]